MPDPSTGDDSACRGSSAAVAAKQAENDGFATAVVSKAAPVHVETSTVRSVNVSPGNTKPVATAADDDSYGFSWQFAKQKKRIAEVRHECHNSHQRTNATTTVSCSGQNPSPSSVDAVATAAARIAAITGQALPTAATSAPGVVPAPLGLSCDVNASPMVSNSSGSHDDRVQLPLESEERRPISGTDTLGRKVWDKEYYLKKAQEKDEDDPLSYLPRPKTRLKAAAVAPQFRQPLQQRNFRIDLAKELGKTKMVTLQTPKMQQGGFWCDICECLIKDSAAYLDHINGKNHNRLLGMSMRVERVGVDVVRSKLQSLRKATGSRYADEDGTGGVGVGDDGELDEFDRVKRRLEQLQKEEEERKRRKRERKKMAKRIQAQGAGNGTENTEMTEEEKQLAAMGLPTNFSGK